MQELSLDEILKLKKNNQEELYAHLTGLKQDETKEEDNEEDEDDDHEEIKKEPTSKQQDSDSDAQSAQSA